MTTGTSASGAHMHGTGDGCDGCGSELGATPCVYCHGTGLSWTRDTDAPSGEAFLTPCGGCGRRLLSDYLRENDWDEDEIAELLVAVAEHGQVRGWFDDDDGLAVLPAGSPPLA